MQVSLPNWTVKSMSKLMPKMEKFVDPARYNAKKLARYKHDWLAIKYSKFEKSCRKSTVTIKTSNTKDIKISQAVVLLGNKRYGTERSLKFTSKTKLEDTD